MPAPLGLYAILDVDAFRARGLDLVRDRGALEAVADALLAARPSHLQLRAKHEEARTTLALLRAVAPRARAAGVPLVVNDRVDLAVAVAAEVVHVGQEDLALADVRAIAPRAQVGVSTHDAGQLAAALSERPDYAAFGPVFATGSKLGASPTVGLERLAEAALLAQQAGIPLVAIGGITRENARAVAATGARWGAVISDLVVVVDGRPDLPEIERRARALDCALRGATAEKREERA